MWFLLSSLVIGLIAGLIARILIRGPNVRGCIPPVLLGVAGSLVGGFLGYLVLDKDPNDGALQWSGVVGSIAGATAVLLGYRRLARRR